VNHLTNGNLLLQLVWIKQISSPKYQQFWLHKELQQHGRESYLITIYLKTPNKSNLVTAECSSKGQKCCAMRTLQKDKLYLQKELTDILHLGHFLLTCDRHNLGHKYLIINIFPDWTKLQLNKEKWTHGCTNTMSQSATPHIAARKFHCCAWKHAVIKEKKIDNIVQS
jgi:hypothetical protein